VRVRRRSDNPSTRSGSALPEAQRLRDLFQVVERRLGRLVTVARIFSQEPMDQVVESSRHLRMHAMQPGNLGRHVREQDRADRVSLKRWPPAQALEQDQSGGIEV